MGEVIKRSVEIPLVLQKALKKAGKDIRKAKRTLMSAENRRRELLDIVTKVCGSDAIDEVGMQVFIFDTEDE